MLSDFEVQCCMYWRTVRKLRDPDATSADIADHLFDLDCYAAITDSPMLKQRCRDTIAAFERPPIGSAAPG